MLGSAGILVTSCAGSSGCSNPNSSRRSKSSFSRLPRVRFMKFSSCLVAWHHCDNWAPQYPQNCRCVLSS
jgi:hypothetical protein